MQFLDKLGWPVERFKGRWFLNFLRLVIHTRKIKRGKFKHANPPAKADGANSSLKPGRP